MTYTDFLLRKSQLGGHSGFEPLWMPDFLFPFQRDLTTWAIQKGKAAIFADCGLGKTPMQLVWSQNVVQKTNRPVLILTPLAVGHQTVGEAKKFGIPCERSRDGAYRNTGIVITNYEKLHLFDSSEFGGVVCDESSILKHFSGATQKSVTRFMLKIPYRLLCTATVAPNDYAELGCSAEALGELGMIDMLSRFFRQDNTPAHRRSMMEQKRNGESGYAVALTGKGWRMKGHAVIPFWKWVSSWARACRKPSDMGYPDDGFVLPPLNQREHVVEPKRPADGMLFTLPAFGLNEERDERRRTLDERCARVAHLVEHDRVAVVWCHLNTEGDRLASIIDGGKQVQGADSDEDKEEAYQAFALGGIRVLIIKPKIGAYGLNWQFCNHVVTFASHSYEQFYQSVRRCWRFGQTQPVTVDIISTTGEERVRKSMQRKADAADKMFTELISYMHDAQSVVRRMSATTLMEEPAWLS